MLYLSASSHLILQQPYRVATIACIYRLLVLICAVKPFSLILESILLGIIA